MNNLGRHVVSHRVLVYEALAFCGIILFIWFDEVLDLPHLLFGAEPTPINWTESMLESAFIAILGIVVIHTTMRIFQRLKTLEGILPVCSSCKKIRDEGGQWQEIEAYIRNRSTAQFSHGICPQCTRRLYPDLFENRP